MYAVVADKYTVATRQKAKSASNRNTIYVHDISNASHIDHRGE